MKKAFLTIAFLAAILSCRHQPEAKLRGADVILLNIETLRADVVGAYGSKLGWTPNLDKIASQGILFHRSYTVAPWTRPSVASLWTGISPPRHRALVSLAARQTGLPESAMTWAELMKHYGYHTFAFVTNANLSPSLGFNQGFDTYLYKQSARATELNRATLDWLDKVLTEKARKPVFIALHYVEPHDALFATPFGSKLNLVFRDEVIRTVSHLSMHDKLQAIGTYQRLISEVDRRIGELVSTLQSRLSPNFLLIITADHGEEWGDHGGVFHGYTLHNELLAVPLIFYSPKLQPRPLNGIVRNIDVMPTVLDLTGLDIPKGIDGQSIAKAVVTGQGEFPHEVFAHTRFARRYQGLFDERFKLIEEVETGKTWLFDEKRDPAELTDCSQSFPDVAERMKRRLKGIRRSLDQRQLSYREEVQHTSRKALQLVKKLRTLGYFSPPFKKRRTAPLPKGRPQNWIKLYQQQHLSANSLARPRNNSPITAPPLRAKRPAPVTEAQQQNRKSPR